MKPAADKSANQRQWTAQPATADHLGWLIDPSTSRNANLRLPPYSSVVALVPLTLGDTIIFGL
jgi:hypothetical protein